MDEGRRPIHLRLQESLVGFVANRVRHGAVGVGDHAVGGNDGVPFNAMQSDHGQRR